MLNFRCQSQAIEELNQLSESDKHSILIEGPSGSGKTYLAHEYSKLVGSEDFLVIKPTVDDIREATEKSRELENKIVLCIENLDSGVVAASHALLKFLEEPSHNVYIVVTCIEISRIPDTILSRAMQVVVNPPTSHDLLTYANAVDATKYLTISEKLKRTCHSFGDLATLYKLTLPQSEYLNAIDNLIFTGPVNDVVWKLSKYPDNTPTPITIVLRICLDLMKDNYHKERCIESLNEVSLNRISLHAILSKFVMEVKYGG